MQRSATRLPCAQCIYCTFPTSPLNIKFSLQWELCAGACQLSLCCSLRVQTNLTVKQTGTNCVRSWPVTEHSRYSRFASACVHNLIQTGFCRVIKSYMQIQRGEVRHMPPHDCGVCRIRRFVEFSALLFLMRSLNPGTGSGACVHRFHYKCGCSCAGLQLEIGFLTNNVFFSVVFCFFA